MRPAFVAVLLVVLVVTSAHATTQVRGLPGDLTADLVLGRRDFTEISPNSVVANKLGRPGGTIVDRSISPGRAYIWDAYNNRILGFNLATCYQQSGNCSADLVIGQPSATDWGACNRDASMSTFPVRAQATAETLCGEGDLTQTVLEDGSNTSMWVDANGDLYVPDVFNNRILKYVSPFTTDTVADEVWGQADFSGVYCNRNSSTGTPPASPSTLCFVSTFAGGAGVTLDAQGNLWVADGGNNRVLRFPAGSKTADLVLGQPDFTHGTGETDRGNGLNQMSSPTGIAFDANGRLYVADSAQFGIGNCRVLVFDPPFTSGMSATGTSFGSGSCQANSGHPIESVMNDPWNRGIWTLSNRGWQGYPTLWAYDGTLIQELPHGPGCDQTGGGSLGFDTNRNVLASYYTNCSDEGLFTWQGGTYVFTRGLFSTPNGFNLPALNRLYAPSWVGVAVAGNQLFIADHRLLFWNNPPNVTNGQAPDGYLGTGQINQEQFGQLKGDSDGRLWVAKRDGVNVYQAPVLTGQAPVNMIGTVFPVLGGGTITINQFTGIAPTAHGEFLWISDATANRVVRVRNPLTSPLVDVVLGQTSITGTACNRGLAPEAGAGGFPVADRTMICRSGALTIDRQGNLFVSDHSLEASGNFRLLMFAPFPAAPSSVIFDPEAMKEFPRSGYGEPNTNRGHAYWEVAFDSANHMVAGHNPYLDGQQRLLDYYLDPTRVNPLNHSDPAYTVPDGHLNDHMMWVIATTFDAQDNLYAYDANRGQVRIFLRPLTPSPPVDTTPPTVPANLTAVKQGQKVKLSWGASSDDSGGSITYRVYRNGVQLASTQAANYTDTPPRRTTVTYHVTATDPSGNTSAPSNTVTV